MACLQPLSSLRDFFEVNLDLSKPGSPVGIYQADETIVSRGHIAPPSTIHDCELSNTLVCEGSCPIARPFSSVSISSPPCCPWSPHCCPCVLHLQ